MTAPPFFIVGCGRSGTTLVRTIMDHHRDVSVPVESYFIADYLRWSDVPQSIRDWLLHREFELRGWGMKLDHVEIEREATVGGLLRVLHEAYASDNDSLVWGQKTPRLVHSWRSIKDAIPEARFIHVVRDPRAVASSLIRSNVHRSTPLHAARRWRRDVMAGLEMERQLEHECLRVLYEDLVRDPQAIYASLCRFLGLSYDAEALEFHRDAALGFGPFHEQIHARLTLPVMPDRIASWQQDLRLYEIGIVESVCGDLMPQFGYEISGARSSSIRRSVMPVQRWLRFLGQVVHSERHRRGYLFGLARRRLILGLASNRLMFFARRSRSTDADASST